MENKLIIRTEEWQHTCHDGCCYTYGTSIFINEKQVTSGFSNEIDTILEDVLKHLGYDVKRDFNRNVE